MPKVEGTYPHNMNKVDAANAVGTAIQKLLVSFEATDATIASDGEDNVGFSAKSRGFTISGKVAIKEKEVDVTVVLPIMAIAFKGLVKAGMDKQIPKYLGEAEDG